MKLKIASTVIVALILLGLNVVYMGAQGPMESSIAVKQLEDDAVTYAVAQKTAEGHLPNVWNTIGLCLIGAIWVPSVIKKIKEEL